MTECPPAARSELAPTGKLRVGVNLGNFLLVNKDPATGELRGVVPDLAAELARRLGMTVELITYPGAGQLADAAKHRRLGRGLHRRRTAARGRIEFTPAYVEIQATYLVPRRLAPQTIADVDRQGVRIAIRARAPTTCT